MNRLMILLALILLLTACITTDPLPTATMPPTDTPVPSTATSTLPILTNTIEPSPTPNYWWEQQETIAYILPDLHGVHLVGLDPFTQHTFDSELIFLSPLAWSPDGTKIALYTWKDVYLLDIYTSKYEPLTNLNDDKLHSTTWSPDGTQLAFTSSKGIYIYDLGGNQVLHLDSTNYFDVTWSPDGSYLAIGTIKGDSDLLLYSFSMQSIFSIAKTIFDEEMPSWSPDGKRIAYIRRLNMYSSDLFIYDVETTETIRLTANGAYNEFPNWSPDGTMIAFEHNRFPLQPDIYVIDLDSGNLIQISNFAGTESWPVWSSDGKKIVFEFLSDPNDEDEINAGKIPMEPSGIWVYDLQSESFVFIEGSEDSTWPAWRP